ncbi:MAG: ATP-binding protein, partial [Dehalococcoidia bacterium]|nr:ATP-binding protein [Dehalococcoidia bacterium]
MRYITEVRIQNFQSHAGTRIKFHPGLNAITGPSDSGKSTILRAIRWVAWNQSPDGDWVRQGTTYASVGLVISDGTQITRERKGKRNFYVIERPGHEPLELADFGLQVPLEVLEAHGMQPIHFDSNRPSLLNLATQLEPPFFITDPAPQRARIVGRLAGVHVADRAIQLTNGDLQAISRETKAQKDELARLEQQLQLYADIDTQEQCLARAEAALES